MSSEDLLDRVIALWDGSEPLHAPLEAGAHPLNDLLGSLHRDPEAILAGYRGRIKVFQASQPGGRRFIDRSEAVSLLGTDCTLYLIDYSDVDSEIGRHLEALKSRSGFQGAIFSVFMSFDRAVMPYHWDAVNNLTFQVLGRKLWTTHPNSSCLLPDFNFAPSVDRLVDSLASRIDRPVVLDPASERHFDLAEGDMLFVPRGLLHKTASAGPSISASLTVVPDLLYRRVAERVGEILSQDVEFRRDLNREMFRLGREGAQRLVEDLSRSLCGRLGDRPHA